VQVTGEGHGHWVDEEADFTPAEQRALVLSLLTYAPDPETPLPRPAPPPPLLREALTALGLSRRSEHSVTRGRGRQVRSDRDQNQATMRVVSNFSIGPRFHTWPVCMR
jgi:hypothetical protein